MGQDFDWHNPQLRDEFYRRTVRDAEGCLLWTGNVYAKRGGYGCCTMRKFGIVNVRAHRVAWQIEHGPIGRDQHVLHRCDKTRCVDDQHLFLGDQATNMADKTAKGRQLKGETHPKHKITEIEAIAIREDNRPQKVIADSYGVSVSTVSSIQHAHSWKHLGPPVRTRYKRAA